ncbi:hypothetical protein QBC38DRAFT_372841 [Podospora fimiseda]|uniref:Uncharacterized protein n=1 Tax=Podospora fimiseda TaxID=252190 RepID=A0AAN7GP54_9PEZI|nr:hypothetical protein QBC38DRAFT_372841 [Podospora fimiseda]
MPLSMPRFPSEAASYSRKVAERWTSSNQKHRSKMSLQHSVVSISAIFVVLLSSLFLSPISSAPTETTTTTTTSTCVSQTQPNPLAESFPNSATGVLNATLAIIPIPLDLARRLVPPQYGILENAYRSLLPNFPEGMYPVLIQAAHDHDVQFRAYGITIDDFSRVGFEFPFLDLLGDGYSSFRWAPSQLITATNDIALEGSRAYGTIVTSAEYEPTCNAYSALPNGATYFKGSAVSSQEFVEVEMKQLASCTQPTFSIDLFKNITNQPTFANGTTCDNMIRLFNTSMSVDEFAPRMVRGRVKANALPFEGQQEWTGVHGIQIATPFIENNYLDCQSMKGYTGTGPGDSFMGFDLNDL